MARLYREQELGSDDPTAPPASLGDKAEAMGTLISSVALAIANAASDVVKVAKFVETSVLPC